MRKRIQQMAMGKFEYARPLLSFSTEKVDIEVLEGKDFTGDFVITSENRVPLRGMIYTSDSRMECLTPQFEGEEVRIRYQFHSNGLVEGDIQKGEFFIICNQGEYNLSFVVSISRLYAETSVGKVRSLNDFARLAENGRAEAHHLFYSKHFKNIIAPGEKRERLIYEGLCQGEASHQKVEEFLVGIREKKGVEISIVRELSPHDAGISGGILGRERGSVDVFFWDVTESRREKVRLQKSQWGYIDINIRSDAEFLVPGKRHLTEEDFIGSVCDFEFYIEESALHAGKNYGRMCFVLPGEEIFFSVCASRDGRRDVFVQTARRKRQAGWIRLLSLYMDYRLKKIVTGAWASQSTDILDQLMTIDPGNQLCALMKAQALIVNRQRQEAAWIMDEYKRGCAERDTPEWGYYLYLCTLVEREPAYVDRMAREIELLFHKNPDSSLLFWILLFVGEDYCRSNMRRFRSIEQWVARGHRSPYLYLEAYYLIWQDPYLLGRLGKFEIEVLNWARKQGAITKDIAIQVQSIAEKLREFDRFVYEILVECYRVNPEDEMLCVLCGYLIRGQRYEGRYHLWYARGIERGIRITSLYEAYLMSLDQTRIEEVPKMIQMYFQYDSRLPYRQKAVLFVNIIAAKQRQPDVYQKYKKSMELFALEQIKACHISDNLAVVYDEMLRACMFEEEIARALAGVLFTHKLTCVGKKVSQAVILHEELEEVQCVQVVNGTAYFQAYTENYCVVLCDLQGNRFCGSVTYRDEPLMNPKTYIERCLALAPDEFSYLLYSFEQDGERVDQPSMEICLWKLLQSQRLKKSYRAELLAKLLDFYRGQELDFSHRDNALGQYIAQAETERLPIAARRRLIELLTEAHRYDRAYQMVQADGYDYLGGDARVSLCSYAITDIGFEEDDFLLGFVESTFLLGKYSDVLLIYLCKYFTGATREMVRMWRAAGEFLIDTFDLEERILTQMLYTADYTPCAEEIYESYCAGGGRDWLCTAYLSCFANCYVRRDAIVPTHVFVQLQERYLGGEELNEACRLGLLKYLAEKKSLTETQRQIADALLAEYTGQMRFFEFYRTFEVGLLQKYHLCDESFLEYRTDPGRRVTLHFRTGEEAYQSEELTEMYDGLYVRPFLLFFGETVQYYITEEEQGEAHTLASGCISSPNGPDGVGDGRYRRLNEMLRQIAHSDGEALGHQMKDYYRVLRRTEDIFGLL